MALLHPSERLALEERVTRLESENQRLREIISDKSDQESYLLRRVERLMQLVDELREELQLWH